MLVCASDSDTDMVVRRPDADTEVNRSNSDTEVCGSDVDTVVGDIDDGSDADDRLDDANMILVCVRGPDSDTSEGVSDSDTLRGGSDSDTGRGGLDADTVRDDDDVSVRGCSDGLCSSAFVSGTCFGAVPVGVEEASACVLSPHDAKLSTCLSPPPMESPTATSAALQTRSAVKHKNVYNYYN